MRILKNFFEWSILTIFVLFVYLFNIDYPKGISTGILDYPEDNDEEEE